MKDEPKVTPDAEVIGFLAEWQRSKEHVDAATRDFKRLDTIANAQYDGPSGKNPNIGDTTTAGIIRQIMRTAVKVIPNVKPRINGSESTPEAIICRFLVEDVVLNTNTFAKGFINTLQLGGRGALSRGFNVFQVATTKMHGQFGVIPKMIHYSDFGIEPGVQDGSLSPYFYIRTKMTPGKVNSIVKNEEGKAEGQSTWDKTALKALVANGPDSSGSADYAEYLTPMEQSKIDSGADTFDIISRYSDDRSQPIKTFSPTVNQPLRKVPNRSKFGFPRTLFLVIDPAELSPFGDSRVRLASPNQNFLMALRQNVATTWLYNSKPTMVKTGVFTGATNLKAGGVITSTDPTAKINLLTLDTTTSQQYPTISEGIVKQIQGMMGMNPGQALGAIGESKTGIGAQTQRQGIDDSIQQITNIIEEFLRQYVISALDLYISEQEGAGIIYVDDTTRQDILRLDPNAFPDPKNPNALEMNWTELYDYIQKIDVTIDSTMSKQEYTDEKRADLQDAVTVMSQTSDPNDPRARARKEVVEDKLFDETAPELAAAVAAVPNEPMPAQQDLTQPPQ